MKCSSRAGGGFVLALLHTLLSSAIAAGSVRQSHLSFRKQLLSVGNDTLGHREKRCTWTNADPQFVPRGFNCPAECPYSQRIARDRCNKVCVPGDVCGLMHPARPYPDHSSMLCAATCGHEEKDRIAGCAECAGPGRCKKCSSLLYSGFKLREDGKECVPVQGYLWPTVYGIIGLAALFILIYLCMMTCRPTLNEANLEKGLEHRGRAIPRQPDHSPYPLCCTNVHSTRISGIGVQLYFNWVIYVIFVAAMLLVITATVYNFTDMAETTGTHIEHSDGDCEHSAIGVHGDQSNLPGAEQSEMAKDHHEDEMKKYDQYNRRMFLASLGLSVLFTFSSLAFAFWQSRQAVYWCYHDPKPQRFAVFAQGFKEDDTDPKSIQDYFEGLITDALGPPADSLQSHIVGVSICYDFYSDQDLIDEAVEEWIVDESGHRGSTPKPDQTPRSKTYALSVVDPYMFGLAPSGGSLETEEEEMKRVQDIGERIKPALEKMTNAGECYIICRSTLGVQALKKLKTTEFGGQEIKMRDVHVEPPEVYFWARTRESNLRNVLLGIAMLLATICLWVALYLPYALDYVAYSSIPGRSPNFLEDLLLGLLIAVGNIIVANVIEIVVPWFRLPGKDRRDRVVLSLGFLATLLNTFFDLLLVMQVAKGTQVNEAFEGKSTGYDRVLASELMVLIVPGYLVIPYVLTPIFEHVLPYVAIKSVVRTREVAQHMAEVGLEPPPFDICWRYSDICNNFTICCAMMLFVTPNAWKVMGFLTCFAVLIYVIDYFKLLRYTMQTYYTTHRLSDAFAYWFGVPLSCVCAVAVYWAVKTERLDDGGMLTLCLPVIYFILYEFCLHMLLTWSKRKEQDDAPALYDDVMKEMAHRGSTFDYFNCNPIFCLRDRWLNVKEASGRKRIVPWVQAKQHLQDGTLA